MADNYLEKKMEEHARGLRPRHTSLTPTGQRPGTAVLPFDVEAALIWAPTLSPMVEAVARALRNTGCHVALGLADGAGGNLFAQQAACKFYPGCASVDDLSDKVLGDRHFPCQGVTAHIVIGPTIELTCGDYHRCLAPTDADTAAIATVYALLPLTRSAF